ncbi:hypothetical protein MNB_SUP05-SYMBIONT-7-316 [hydrothermal vent metagenome]|uniref:Uncharacterized protein n=1 Tax=hydrothermal vent metagenome TaxID=652676 RepID=A0A1W1E4X5_9ZZZZ
MKKDLIIEVQINHKLYNTYTNETNDTYMAPYCQLFLLDQKGFLTPTQN